MKCYTTNKDGVFICTEKTLEKDERIEMNPNKAFPGSEISGSTWNGWSTYRSSSLYLFQNE